MSEDDFDLLREHLKDVFPIFDKFCASSGYKYVDPNSIGRYPRIRVEKIGSPVYWVELWMELDEKGDRYQSFFNEVPYELSAGAYYDVEDGTEYGCRYQRSLSVFKHRPFKNIPIELYQYLCDSRIEVEKWTGKLLKERGEKVNLG